MRSTGCSFIARTQNPGHLIPEERLKRRCLDAKITLRVKQFNMI